MITMYYLSTLPIERSLDLFSIHPEWMFDNEEHAIKEAKRVDSTSKELGWARADQWFVHKIEARLISTTEVEIDE